MSDPVRWRSASGGASHEARELLRHAHAPRALDAAARARNAAAVAKIAAGHVAAPTITAGMKLLAGFGLVSAVALTTAVTTSRARAPKPAHTTLVARPSPPPAAAPVVAPAPSPVAAPVAAPVLAHAPPVAAALPIAAPPPVVAAHAPVVAAHVPAVARPPVVAAPAPPAASSATGISGGGIAPHNIPSMAATDEALDAETHLIGPAFAQAEHGDAQSALTQLDLYEHQFPHGQYAADCEWLRVRALQRLGRIDEARAHGEALLARYPSSLYVQRTRRLLDALR